MCEAGQIAAGGRSFDDLQPLQSEATDAGFYSIRINR